MNKKTRTTSMVKAALVAALYVLLTLITNMFGMASGVIQVKYCNSYRSHRYSLVAFKTVSGGVAAHFIQCGYSTVCIEICLRFRRCVVVYGVHCGCRRSYIVWCFGIDSLFFTKKAHKT